MEYDHLPYGAYLCRKSVVFFDRKYRPLISLPWTHLEWPTGRLELDPAKAKIIAPDVRVKFEAQVWFYNDGCTPRRDQRTRAKLKRMLDVLPLLDLARVGR
jgi:hypothetical protein